MSSLDNRIICKIFQLEYNDSIDMVQLLMNIRFELDHLVKEKELAEKELEGAKDLIEFQKEQIEYLRKRDS